MAATLTTDPISAGLSLATEVLKGAETLQAEKNTAAEIVAKEARDKQTLEAKIRADLAAENVSAIEAGIAAS